MTKLDGRPVLVTGAGGFIGGHLVARLVAEGARVRAFVRYDSRGDRGTLDWLEPAIVADVEVVAGELRDVESVARAVAGTEVVFHLGAQIAIPYSYVNPRDFFEVNVLGTLNVVQAALGAGVARVIHTSTSEVYGSARTVPITEEHPLEPQSPYAASKVAADKLVDSYHRSFDLPAAIVRPFNTYGPHQSARAILPTIISQALAGTTLRLGSLHPRRDMTYVEDTAAAFVAVAEADDAVLGRTLQLGTGADVAIGELVQLVGELLGKELTSRPTRRACGQSAARSSA
jgi:nucleoside-diphosphate-sugar epimerase